MLGMYVLLQLSHAWLVDDAYITLRTVDNFVHGLGLRWNPDERVQSYTNPLWMFGLSLLYAVTKEAFYTTIAASLATSFAAVGIVVGVFARNGEHYRALLLLAVLLGSKAFLDYSSSGLENPLTHLLLALFYVRFFQGDSVNAPKRVATLIFIAALGFVNRMDTILLFAPACCYEIYEQRREGLRSVRSALLGSLPAFGWTLFALFYYGSVVPNTAIAKLAGPGVTFSERLSAGVAYYVDEARWDPLSLLACGVALAVCVLSRNRHVIAGSAGLGLYLVYVLTTGAIGTHMTGRFFSGPVFLAALLLARETYQIAVASGACALTAFWLAASPVSPLRVGHDSYARPRLGRNLDAIIDTRSFVLEEGAALLDMSPGERMPRHPWYRAGEEFRNRPERVHVGGLVVSLAVGYSAFASGPDKHFIDVLGLCDPLIARIPLPPEGAYRPGHFFRPIPSGYVESIEQRRNVVADPDLRLYYEKILLVTRGDLFSLKRLQTIFSLNLGAYDHLLAAYAQRNGLRAP